MTTDGRSLLEQTPGLGSAIEVERGRGADLMKSARENIGVRRFYLETLANGSLEEDEAIAILDLLEESLLLQEIEREDHVRKNRDMKTEGIDLVPDDAALQIAYLHCVGSMSRGARHRSDMVTTSTMGLIAAAGRNMKRGLFNLAKREGQNGLVQ